MAQLLEQRLQISDQTLNRLVLYTELEQDGSLEKEAGIVHVFICICFYLSYRTPCMAQYVLTMNK